jgi:hypothetical protein
MNEGTLALMIPIFLVIGGIAIVIVALVSDHRIKTQIIEKRMEIPMKNPHPMEESSLVLLLSELQSD